MLFFSDCLQGRYAKAAQIRKQILTIPPSYTRQMMSWEILNLISKLPTLDPLGLGMSHGEEALGGHISLLCYSLMFVSGVTQTLWLWRAVWMGSDILKSGVVRFAEEESQQPSCENTRK